MGNLKDISKVTVFDLIESSERVSFQVLYEGAFSGASAISERYSITPDFVELMTDVSGPTEPLAYLWPVFANDGVQTVAITIENGQVSATLRGSTVRYTALGARSVRVEQELYANRNGWSRLAVAEYPAGGPITLRIELLA